MSIDFSAYPILCVDDEQPNLLALEFALGDDFNVISTTSTDEALKILGSKDIAILLADQRMPGMSGSELCARSKEIRPETVRMIVTAYADLHTAMDAINRGEVMRYIAKPWRDEELAELLRSALYIVHVQRGVRDMEMRLLRTTATTAAYTIHAEVAHEISNVLHAMKLNAEIAHDHLAAISRTMQDPQRALPLATTARQCTGDVLTAVEQLEQIVNRLRHGDSLPPREQPKCDAAHAVDTTVRMLRADVERVAKLRLVVDASPTVLIDSTMLAQVVVNLLTNAAQVITPGARDTNEIIVRVGVDGDRGFVSVTDTGPGIPENLIDRVFDPGVTTKTGSSGIGLSIVRDVVARAGGKVSAENMPEGGARFSVFLQAVPR